MAVEILQRFTCDYCGQVKMMVILWDAKPGYAISYNLVAHGWQWVGQELVCDRHEVMVKDKVAGEA